MRQSSPTSPGSSLPTAHVVIKAFDLSVLPLVQQHERLRRRGVHDEDSAGRDLSAEDSNTDHRTYLQRALGCDVYPHALPLQRASVNPGSLESRLQFLGWLGEGLRLPAEDRSQPDP